jgi:hypothetical protein
METEKKPKNTLRRLRSLKQKITVRQYIAAGSASVALVVLLFFAFNFSGKKEAKAATTMETLSAGSFIVNMGIVPQTYANGMKPYGLVYDLVRNYFVPVKWVIEPSKVKDGTDFTYNAVAYKGGPFIIPAEFISAAVAARITYWQSQGVQGIYTTGSITVPVYMTITSYPNIMIDSLSSNQNIAVAYFTNAGIPSSAYGIGKPSGLNGCHDLWVNPHGDPRWSDYSYLYNFITVQHSYIWCQCHAASVMEGCYNYSPPGQQLNYLSTKGLKCWKSGGGFNCDNLITESHITSSTAPYTYNYSADPVMQFMGSMANPTKGGSEQWYQPMSTGAWRGTTRRLVTTATGTSPNEGVLMAYGPGYGVSTNGYVMYTAGHDLNATGSSVADWVAAQRSFLNYVFLAGAARSVLFTSYTIPTTFTGLTPQDVSVTVTSGTGPYTYHWTSSYPGYFLDSTAASTSFVPTNTTSSGVIRCIVTDACNRQNFVAQYFTVTASPLPITLTGFSAQAVNNAVMLRWSTASEVNNEFFTLERSTDGAEFSEITKVRGSGTTSISHYYSFTDENPSEGVSYYRLRQTDIDGRSEVFPAIAVKFDRNPNAIRTIVVTPNPFSESFTAQFNSNECKMVTAELITLKSKLMNSERIMLQAGTNSYRYNSTADLEPGVYVFRILQGNSLLGYAKVVKK